MSSKYIAKPLQIAFLVLFIGLGSLCAQNTFQPKPLDEQQKGYIYNKERTVDFKLHTGGYALGLNFGTIQTYYKTKYYQFEIGEIKHPKEIRSKSFYSSTFGQSAYSYGKQNNFIVLRAGIGGKRYFSEKAKEKGIVLGVNWEIGPTLGLTKPYYIEINTINIEDKEPYIRYTESNRDIFLNQDLIIGSAPFFKGFGEIGLIPGIHGKIAAHFSFGAFDDFVKAVEAGIMLDVFTRKVPILVNDQNKPFFLNLFITLQLGKRY